MAIIPYQNELLLKIYRCPICGNCYKAQTGEFRVTCAAPHLPGDCCHHGERQINKKLVEQIMAIVDKDNYNGEHHCEPSSWIQGAIGIVHLPPGQGQLNGGWHIVFWQSETEWDRSLAIIFCPYCGQNLENRESLPENDDC